MKKFFKRSLQSGKIFNLFYGGIFNKKQVRKCFKMLLKKQRLNFNNGEFVNTYILKFFESRLDSVIYRTHLSTSMADARQLISHGHVYVNKKLNTNYSCVLKSGDLIEIKSVSFLIIKKNLEYNRNNKLFWPIPPKHLHINYRTMQILFGNIAVENYPLTYSFPFWLDMFSVTHHYLRN